MADYDFENSTFDPDGPRIDDDAEDSFDFITPPLILCHRRRSSKRAVSRTFGRVKRGRT